MIDVNVNLGCWPFRKLAGDEPASLVERLRRARVTQAWVGSLDGLFQRDVAGVNLRLAEECRRADPELLVPFGTVNPALPDWEEDLRRCHEVHKLRGIRLHPGFHGYALDDPAVARLLALASERRLIVELVGSMEDERTQHPVFRTPHVDLKPLPKLVNNVTGLKLVLLNVFRKLSLDEAAKLAATGRVWFDIAMLEGVDRLSALVKAIGPKPILFGSHFPLFYIESAALKLTETTLPGPIVEVIRIQNAARLMEV